MEPEKQDFIRSLSKSSLQEFQVALLGRLAEARRDFREATLALREARNTLQFIDRVLKERALGNVVEFHTTSISEDSKLSTTQPNGRTRKVYGREP